MIYLYLVHKPLDSLAHFANIIQESKKYKFKHSTKLISIGWQPFHWIPISLFLIIIAFALKPIYRSRTKLLFISCILLLCSMIPSVMFYNAVLTMGGFLVTAGILFYLLTTILITKIIGFFTAPKKLTNDLLYPLQNKKLSIVIPAYNEEKSIATTLSQVYTAAKKLDDFEIMIVDDGSKDNTYSVALNAASQLGPEISVTSHKTNQGVGATFLYGINNAKFPHITLIPGDNAYCQSGIESLFSKCGEAPLVISYRQNMEARTPIRHLLSRMATLALRMISGIKVRDAHSLYVFPVAEVRALNIQSIGYGYHIEILSRLLRNIRSYSEVPVKLNPKTDASSGVMKPKTLTILGYTICKLFIFRLLRKL